MAKKKSKKSAQQVDTAIADAPKVDLRKLNPVPRMRGQLVALQKKLAYHLPILKSWAGENESSPAHEASTELGNMINEFKTIDGCLGELEDSGFAPQRKSYTAKVEEGDKVTVLEAERERYTDIMEADEMANMTVIRRQPGKGGGLIVESVNQARMKVATSHVVRLSAAE